MTMNTDPKTSHIALLYRFCAQALQYPQPDWFTPEFRDGLLLLLDNLEAFDERDKVSDLFEKEADLIEALQVEYTRLFINGVPHVAAPPYGSVYIDKSLRGSVSEKTQTFYRDNGFTLKEGSDFPDHIVHQLEFLSILAEKGEEQAEKQFLKTLFLPWFPAFRKRVEDEARNPFYPVVVGLIDFFTTEECEHEM